MRPTFRYPGVQPFTTEQQHVFFGREQDISELYRTVRREPLTVLYGKSGLGKSSLLNAGIIPECGKDGAYSPVSIRFGAWTEGVTDTPLEIAKKLLADGYDGPTFLDRLLQGDTSLWYVAKTRQLNGGGRPLLIFDQFEELFTYPESAVKAFGEELAELLHTGIPLRFRRMADTADLTDEEEDRLENPLEARILFAIRSDRMHLMHQLADRLPNILRNLYELRALAPDDARRAIVQPAAAKGEFNTPSFTWSLEALTALLAFLEDPDDNRRVEGILLQLLCQYFEEKKIAGMGLTALDAGDLGDLEQIVENYYFEKINSLGNPESRLAARRLIEEGLVMEGENIRLSLHEAQIARQYGVDSDLLERLVNSRLLRAEPFLRGGYSYELAHDRLVAPVLKAKQERLAEELLAAKEKERLQKEKELAEAQRKRRRALLLAGIMSLLAIAAAGVAIWAFSLKNKAQNLTEITNRQKIDIQSKVDQLTEKEADLQASLQTAREAKDTAEARRIEAELATNRAVRQEQVARLARMDAETNLKAATEANKKVVQSFLRDADTHILNLEYNKALDKARTALALNLEKDAVAARYLEVAFWYGETGNMDAVTGLLDTAALLTGKPKPALKRDTDKTAFRAAVEKLDPDRYALFMRRYYPFMAPVKGGTFMMGCDSVGLKRAFGEDSSCPEDETQHPAVVSDFQIAETETTFWQFGLYCAATGKNIGDFRPNWLPTGDHPVVSVSWYDAVEYANWVSRQFGRDTVYSGDLRSDDVVLAPDKNGFRLPTEAEWEYAARAGGNLIFSGTSSQDSLYLYANYDENGAKDGFSYSAPVKSYRPNKLGLYDMSGNALEWCWDWYGAHPAQSGSGYAGVTEGGGRVLRGGSWDDNGYICRVSYRGRYFLDYRDHYYGFRLARAR